MVYTSLDKVIKGYLLQRRYPIHWYIDFLIYAQRGFEEMSFDTIGNIRSVKLTLNSYGAATLPTDFLDWVKVGLQNGQFVKPMIQRDGMNRLNNFQTGTTVFDATFDTTFEEVVKIPFPSVNTVFGTAFAFGLYNNIWYNDHIEYIGRHYGIRVDRTDSFKVIKERNEIQFHNFLCPTSVVLDYVSDGSSIDNATQITPYAKSTIEAYINWKYKENNRSYSEGERMRAERQFDHQNAILRGRQNDMTKSDFKGIIYRNTSGAPK